MSKCWSCNDKFRIDRRQRNSTAIARCYRQYKPVERRSRLSRMATSKGGVPMVSVLGRISPKNLHFLTSNPCSEYVRAYIQVKHYYDLSIDSAEKAAASDVLNNVC